MAEPTQKEMLRSLIVKVDHMSTKQDNMKIKQDEMQLAQNDMLIELKGTTMEPSRGVVSRLIQVEKCVAAIKKKQYKIYTWALVLVAGLNAAFLGLKALVSLIKGG